ncbi:MAG: hypothetical protein SOW48_01790 [Peptoniphilaceae bacterium]|nr:hypothetical protein [Peptoniphilaceae bacterium]MDY3075366.1 hypothetical protein [Peptoniphilaceae bacterium]
MNKKDHKNSTSDFRGEDRFESDQVLLDYPHPTSGKHPRMDRKSRAAQFAPFAALTGYDEAIRETGRAVKKKPELSEDDRDALDRLLLFLEQQGFGNKIRVRHFVADVSKEGGRVEETEGILRRTDSYSCRLIFMDGRYIPMQDILRIECLFPQQEDF